jgi:hypothetical protein
MTGRAAALLRDIQMTPWPAAPATLIPGDGRRAAVIAVALERISG